MELVLDENGYWKLDEIPYKKIKGEIKQKDASSDIDCIEINGKLFYKKKVKEETYGTNELEDLQWYNNILIPAILAQFEIEHAEYFLGIEKGKRYIISPSFLKPNETLILGDEILDEEFLLSGESCCINERLNKIGDYLKQKGENDEFIKKQQLEHLKQVFAEKFIEMIDFHEGNWGIIESTQKKQCGMAPFMDYDNSCEKIENDNDNYVADRKSSLKDFIEYYREFPGFYEFVKKAYNNFNLRQAFQDSYNRTHCKIGLKYIYYYNDYFNQRMIELKNAIENDFRNQGKNDYYKVH